MSDCCSTSCDSESAVPASYTCPQNNKTYRQVALKTILHHIKRPWNLENEQQGYYFCDDPDCDVVYFGQDDGIIWRKELRGAIGVKEKSAESLLCYCFDITYQQASDYPLLKDYVIGKTREKLCECTTQNPAGTCCLKEFKNNR